MAIFENDLLKLIFHGTPIPGLADNAATGALTTLYLALHTAAPVSGGPQTMNEANYTGYARIAVARSAEGWTVVGNDSALVADQFFPAASNMTNLPQTGTHVSIGTAATGAGKILFTGPLPELVAFLNTTVRAGLAAGI